MAAVNQDTMTPQHMRAARALLGWSVREMAKQVHVAEATIKRCETGQSVQQISRMTIFDAFKEHGVWMVDGDSLGVGLRNTSVGQNIAH
ncbi:helix-turn-helix domain-containing protein [Hellea sp.]|nr:helix-turn-helix domain-containing protein [Hellea sp.]